VVYNYTPTIGTVPVDMLLHDSTEQADVDSTLYGGCTRHALHLQEGDEDGITGGDNVGMRRGLVGQ